MNLRNLLNQPAKPGIRPQRSAEAYEAGLNSVSGQESVCVRKRVNECEYVCVLVCAHKYICAYMCVPVHKHM